MIYINVFVALFLGHRLVNADYHSRLGRNLDGIFFAWNFAEVLMYIDKILQALPQNKYGCMKTFWESFLLTLFKACAIIIALAVFFWWLTPLEDAEEEVDPFSVTITYHCKEVLADTDEIPEHVVSECKKLLKELQNASQSGKPSV